MFNVFENTNFLESYEIHACNVNHITLKTNQTLARHLDSTCLVNFIIPQDFFTKLRSFFVKECIVSNSVSIALVPILEIM